MPLALVLIIFSDHRLPSGICTCLHTPACTFAYNVSSGICLAPHIVPQWSRENWTQVISQPPACLSWNACYVSARSQSWCWETACFPGSGVYWEYFAALPHSGDYEGLSETQRVVGACPRQGTVGPAERVLVSLVPSASSLTLALPPQTFLLFLSWPSLHANLLVVGQG